MRKFAITVLLATTALAGGNVAHAVTFTGSATGSWGTPTGTSSGDVYSIANNDNTTNANTSNFSFGTAATGSYTNLFTFNGANSFSTSDETVFDIAAFSYRNGMTNNYPENSSVGLSIQLALSSPIMQSNTFTYNFAIDITPNTTGNNVADGDIVSISNGKTSTTFVANGTVYTLALLGFSSDGGKTITTQFLSPENSTANADVYARITSATSVPEPTGIGVLGVGLLAVGMIARRRFIG